MLGTLACWDALVAELVRLGHHLEVKKLPLETIVDAAFLQTLPALKLPAAIVTLRGLDQSIEGAGRYRGLNWSLISAVKDVSGVGYATNLGIYDQLVDGDGSTVETRFLDKQILGGELTILGTHSLGIAVAHESLSVLELTFSTREANERSFTHL